MENGEFKDLNEVKEAMIDFVLDMCEHFPYSGKIMKDSIPRMTSDIRTAFSSQLLSYLDEYLRVIMNYESVDSIKSRDFEVMIGLVRRYIERCDRESGGNIVLARSLQRHLKLELKAYNILSENERIMKQIEKDFDGKKTAIDIDPDAMHDIIKEYISLKRGAKPKKSDSSDKNLECAMKIDKAHTIRRKLVELEKEKDKVIEGLKTDPPKVTDKYNFLSLITGERIRELNRGCANYDELKAKREIEAVREKIRHVYRVIEMEKKWTGLKKKAERYFKKNGNSESAISEIDPSMLLRHFAQAG